ncbi:hypothetical protein GCM10025865_32160 [Paraoerskovia sediminicola]|uniref:YlxR domain-containing protein n=1 Tax=Paraoerskovia sediminicola TaxID=1138587 RepID=A0ABM8G6X9_9CELL|nr:hypothetical protein GCM10025865_32160 [Paraoerskovia sediminicola]
MDDTRSSPGRGAWIHEDPACLEQALRRRALQRALRVPARSAVAIALVDMDSANVRSNPTGRTATEHRSVAPARHVDKEAGQKPMGTR